jgi:hypothetical protein
VLHGEKIRKIAEEVKEEIKELNGVRTKKNNELKYELHKIKLN